MKRSILLAGIILAGLALDGWAQVNCSGGLAANCTAADIAQATATAQGGAGGAGGNVGNVTANGGTHTQTALQTATQVSTSTNLNSAAQQQGQVGINKQGQGQLQEANNEGNSLAVNTTNPVQKLQAPSTATQYAMPSANCYATNGGTVSIPGGSASLGLSKLDEDCVKREWYRLVGGEQGLRVACTSTVFEAANPLDCDKVKQVRPSVAAAAPAKKVELKDGGGNKIALSGGRQ